MRGGGGEEEEERRRERIHELNTTCLGWIRTEMLYTLYSILYEVMLSRKAM